MDMVVQIEDEDNVFTEGQTRAILTGTLFDGSLFQGSDNICIVP